MSRVHIGFVLQSDWYCQSEAPEVDNFPRGCYQAFFSRHFWGESLGTRLGDGMALDLDQ